MAEEVTFYVYSLWILLRTPCRFRCGTIFWGAAKQMTRQTASVQFCEVLWWFMQLDTMSILPALWVKCYCHQRKLSSCFATDGLRHVDLNLVRRATSEGRFMCGPASQPYELIGRSNIMDTFEGGLYHGSFEQAARLLCAVRDGRGIGDASILDQVWDLLKGYKGFGGAENNAEGNVKGFVAKNIVFQGLRNILRVWCLERSATNRFVSRPNPCKLVAVAVQKLWCSRSEHHNNFTKMFCQDFEG